MSLVTIQKVFEVALAALTPPMDTAWENADFTPSVGVPYQAAYLLPAQPDNPEIGSGYIQRGIFQINLFYPQGKGWKSARTKAEQLRAAFPRGLSLTDAGVIVNIIATPEIGPARAEDDLYFVPVKVRWSAQFFGG
jgi:hypothetical protein